MFKLRTGVALTVCALLVMAMAATYGAESKAKAKAAPAKAQAKASTAAASQAGPTKITLKQYIQWAGKVGYVLIGLSVLGVVLMLKNLFFVRRGVLAPKKTQQQLNELFNQKQIKQALEFCQKDGSVLATIVGAGLSEIRSGYDSMVDIMDDVADEEAIKMNQGVGYLSLIGAVAPMVGLLGTVLGMINAFSKIATAEGMAKPAELAGSIQQALVTTCMGLIVAVPAIVAYAVFRNRAVRLMLEVGVVATELTSRFKALKAVTAAPAAAPKPAAQPKPQEAPKAQKPKPEGAEAGDADDKKE